MAFLKFGDSEFLKKKKNTRNTYTFLWDTR